MSGACCYSLLKYEILEEQSVGHILDDGKAAANMMIYLSI